MPEFNGQIELGAQPDELGRLAGTLEEATQALRTMLGHLRADYPSQLDGSWQGEARGRFDQNLTEATGDLNALAGEYEALTGLLRQAAAQYGAAETEAEDLAQG